MDEVSVLLKQQSDVLAQIKESIKRLETGHKALKKLNTFKEPKKTEATKTEEPVVPKPVKVKKIIKTKDVEVSS